MTIQYIIDTILQYHAEGDFQKARELFLKVLETDSDSSQNLHMLGMAAKQMGDIDQALNLVEKAIQIDPGFAEAHNTLAITYHSLNRIDDAINSFQDAIAVSSQYVDAYYNLGNVQFQLGRHEDAVLNYQRTITIKPDFFQAYSNQAVVLKELGRLDEAEEILKKVILQNPLYSDAHINLGIVYEEAGRLDEAVSSYKMAIYIDPDIDFVHLNLGNTFRKQRDFISAIDSYKLALTINQNLDGIHFNLGNTYKELDDFDAAIASYKAHIAASPNDPGGYSNLGGVYKTLGLMEDAIKNYQKVIAISPDNCEVHSVLIFLYSYLEGISGEFVLKETQRWNALHSVKEVVSNHNNERDPNRRLRIGYVSADFRKHAVAYLLEPLLIEHNRNEVEIYCYAEVEKPDRITKRFQKYSDHWRSTFEVDDVEMDAMIRRDEIDILVDCTGHTNNNRLAALSRKPAPIQVNYFPMHGQTLGMPAINYILGDPVIMPSGFEGQFSEQLINLEHGAFPFQPNPDWPEVAPPRSIDDQMIFACVGDPARISEPTIDLWARMLELTPDSKILFKHQSYENPNSLRTWKQQFSRLAERTIFEGVEGGWGVNMDVYGRVDVVLNTLPMAGGTTCAIPLWMGVPTITKASHYIGHRISMSILTYSGVPEFIAQDDEDYLRITTELINNRQLLARLRKELRPKMKAAPICNAQAQAKDLEKAFRAMWKSWCAF